MLSLSCLFQRITLFSELPCWGDLWGDENQVRWNRNYRWQEQLTVREPHPTKPTSYTVKNIKPWSFDWPACSKEEMECRKLPLLQNDSEENWEARDNQHLWLWEGIWFSYTLSGLYYFSCSVSCKDERNQHQRKIPKQRVIFLSICTTDGKMIWMKQKNSVFYWR